MWEVLEHRRATRQAERLPVEVLKRYEKWQDIVRLSGPPGLRLIRGLRDEALHGLWQGHRSSRLGQQYRIIYRVDARDSVVLVVAITPHHDDRRR